jgi:glycine/D-amino acid oxidase-like deaminating enzyme
MGPVVDAVEADAVQPKRADVVVIGGGIVGVSTAFALAQKGISVVLCEKGHIAGEQSSRNWGWVRKTGRDEREIPLIAESLRMWEGMNKAVGAETGFRACGILYTSQTEADDAYHEDWLRRAEPYQLGTRRLNADEVAGLLPGAATRYRGGMYNPTDGESGARHRRRRPALRRGDPDWLRRAGRGADHRPHLGRGDRTRPHRLRRRRTCWRRVVASVLRKPRDNPASAQGAVVRDADSAGRGAG